MTQGKNSENGLHGDAFNNAEKVRRVLLAEASDGSSFVASDERIEPVVFAGIGQLFTLWGTDEVVKLPDSEKTPTFEGTFPPAGGFRVFMTRFSPNESVDAAGADMPENLRNIPSANDLHSSTTVDCNMLLSGSLDCILSDQSKVTLKAGEVIVLNGAEHAWQNNSGKEAVMLFFISGAERG
jgi:hypothetical protein